MAKCTKKEIRQLKNSAAVENPGSAARAHPDGVAARERDDAAGDHAGTAVPPSDGVGVRIRHFFGGEQRDKSLLISTVPVRVWLK